MSIPLDLMDPNLKEKLATLPEKMLDFAEEVLLEQAHLIVGLAQVYAPVDTGALRDSVRVERGGQGQHFRTVSVRAGGYSVNSQTRRIVDYARVVEGKQPFLKPAVEEVKPTIADMIKAGVVEKIRE